MKAGRSAFKILTCKPRGKKGLGRLNRRWEANIRIDLKQIIREIGFIWLRIGIIGEPL
jgi:hypothetical protein